MAQRKVSCPSCNHTFTPPAAPAKRRAKVLRTDEQCAEVYAALAARGGVEPYMDVFARFGPWAAPMQPAHSCHYCNGPISKLRATERGGICKSCADMIAAKRDRWQDANEQRVAYAA